ncbi:MAG: alpha-glucosidase [Myxococcota bacterium]
MRNLPSASPLLVLVCLACIAWTACTSDEPGTPPVDGDASATDAGEEPLDVDVEATCPLRECHSVGDFWVGWDSDGDGALSVWHREDAERVLWRAGGTVPLLSSAASDVTITESRGSFTVDIARSNQCEQSRINSISLEEATVVVDGEFTDCERTFEVRFTALASRRLEFVVATSNDAGPTNSVLTMTWESQPEEAFFGFGAQYSALNMKGRNLPIWCQEQGHGRGLEPITDLLNEASPGSGGHWYTSYTCVPYTLSNRGYGLLLDHNEYIEFDLRDDETARAMVNAPMMKGQLLYGATPAEIVETYTEYSGRMSPLPAWTQSGAIVRSYGGSEVALGKVEALNAVDGALAALWIEDWVGTRQTPFGTRMWWNWTIDRTIYPDFEEMVSTLSEQGIRSLIYFNPFLADASDKPGVERVLYTEALEGDLLMKDHDGEVIAVDNGGFAASMLDLTNPDTRTWIKGLMVDMIDIGVAGWMADFGEALPVDVAPYSGVEPRAYHNQYPFDWAELNHEMARDAGVLDEHLTFNRSGNAKSPSMARAFWIGDQLVTWDEHDGLKTVIPALLSSGLSGYSLQHSDVGGWLSVDYPAFGLSYYRSKELFQRWLETCTFMVLLRLHTTNLPELNHQYDSDEETLAHFAKMTRVFAALAPYRQTLMEEARDRGLPVARHLMLHYPDDPKVYTLDQQFMLGADFLIAPVVDEGATTVSLYLPAGRWVHLWSGAPYGDEAAGVTLEIDAPIGQPAVFYRAGSAWGAGLREALGLND